MKPLNAVAIDLRRIGMVLVVAAFLLGLFVPDQVGWVEATAMGALGIAAWLGGVWLTGRVDDPA